MPRSVLTASDLATLSALAELNARDVPEACVEVARVIHRTPMGVRYHLGRLWGAGLVVVGSTRLTLDGECLANGMRRRAA
jgi:hypothetical protein